MCHIRGKLYQFRCAHNKRLKHNQTAILKSFLSKNKDSMYSFTVIHESRNLKQARPQTVSMLTCYTFYVLATPSRELRFDLSYYFLAGMSTKKQRISIFFKFSLKYPSDFPFVQSPLFCRRAGLFHPAGTKLPEQLSFRLILPLLIQSCLHHRHISIRLLRHSVY